MPDEGSSQAAAEQFESSELRMSEGRTRRQLNAHLECLGLSAEFAISVVSKRKGRVSHLTFNVGPWNDLPKREADPFVWWLGKGPQRLRDANLINPQIHDDLPPDGVPLFFASKAKQGGALCRYGGHWACSSFKRLGEVQRFKDEERQARISWSFRRFDEGLAQAVNAIPQ